MAMKGTRMLLTLAMRWMPPKITISEKRVSTTPTTTGLKPKATLSALQIVLLWMELYDRPKVREIRMAKSAASQGCFRPWRI